MTHPGCGSFGRVPLGTAHLPCIPLFIQLGAAMGYMIANYNTVTRYLELCDIADCYGAQITINLLL